MASRTPPEDETPPRPKDDALGFGAFKLDWGDEAQSSAAPAPIVGSEGSRVGWAAADVRSPDEGGSAKDDRQARREQAARLRARRDEAVRAKAAATEARRQAEIQAEAARLEAERVAAEQAAAAREAARRDHAALQAEVQRRQVEAERLEQQQVAEVRIDALRDDAARAKAIHLAAELERAAQAEATDAAQARADVLLAAIPDPPMRAEPPLAELVAQPAARRNEQQRLEMAARLERQGASLREFQQWAKGRGLHGVANSELDEQIHTIEDRIERLRAGVTPPAT